MSIQLELNVPIAMDMRDALTAVLDNCDVHAEDAVHLEVLRDMIEFRVEKFMDYTTDLELY